MDGVYAYDAQLGEGDVSSVRPWYDVSNLFFQVDRRIVSMRSQVRTGAPVVGVQLDLCLGAHVEVVDVGLVSIIETSEVGICDILGGSAIVNLPIDRYRSFF